jgi:hypothetical protein
MSESEPLKLLAALLEERLDVIADHAWRDRDAAGHLEQLKSVSERLQQEHQRLRGQLPARLNHYLTQASFSKALEWIRTGGASG